MKERHLLTGKKSKRQNDRERSDRMKKYSGKAVKSEILSLASILSIVVVFAVICAGALSLLAKFNVMEFSFGKKDGGDDGKGPDEETELYLHEKDESAVPSRVIPDRETLRSMIRSTDYPDSVFIRCEMGRSLGDGKMTTEYYDIWRSAGKYKIVKYDGEFSEIEMYLCDGRRVRYTTPDGTVVAYPTDIMTFDRVSPIPSREFASDPACDIVYTNASDGRFEVMLSTGDGGDVYDVMFSMDEILPVYMRQIHDSETVMTYEVLLLSFGVSDKVFSE